MDRSSYARAPLRIGLAGGGCDEWSFCDRYGGVFVSAAISYYCHAWLSESCTERSGEHNGRVAIGRERDLRVGVHNYLRRKYRLGTASAFLETKSDMPVGLGLGSSSSQIVSIVGAYSKLFKLDLSTAQIALDSYEIERVELRWPGGIQDHMAATFGGVKKYSFGPKQAIDFVDMVDAKSLNFIEERLCIFDVGLFKSVEREDTIVHIDRLSDSERLMLKQDALDLWGEFTRDPADVFSSIVNRSQLTKKPLSQGSMVLRMEAIRRLVGVEAVKICGSGAKGVILALLSRTVDELRCEVAKKELNVSIYPIRISKHGVSYEV